MMLRHALTVMPFHPLLASAVAYIVASLVLAVRAHGRLDRAQYAAMGVSVLAMGLAIVV